MSETSAWVACRGFSRRPVVVVEDHLFHLTELLDLLAATTGAEILPHLTAVCLDRSGPDTTRRVAAWLEAHPGLQVAAALEPSEAPEGELPAGVPPRFAPLPAEIFASSVRFCGWLARAVRPGGLLLQDVQLETLAFLPADRWWESIYLANTVRGMFAADPPACRFLSNKRGYAATFGRDLADAGFDPRDVIDKGELARGVVPTLRSYLGRQFPWAMAQRLDGERLAEVLVRGEGDREEIERELDLALWMREDGAVDLGGRLLGGEEGRRRLSLRPGSPEARTWLDLVDDRFAGGNGVAVVDVGRRIAPEGAGKAEITNAAARHVHTLRGRLADPTALKTAHHAYQLGDRLRLGRIAARPPGNHGGLPLHLPRRNDL